MHLKTRHFDSLFIDILDHQTSAGPLKEIKLEHCKELAKGFLRKHNERDLDGNSRISLRFRLLQTLVPLKLSFRDPEHFATIGPVLLGINEEQFIGTPSFNKEVRSLTFSGLQRKLSHDRCGLNSELLGKIRLHV